MSMSQVCQNRPYDGPFQRVTALSQQNRCLRISWCGPHYILAFLLCVLMRFDRSSRFLKDPSTSTPSLYPASGVVCAACPDPNASRQCNGRPLDRALASRAEEQVQVQDSDSMPFVLSPWCRIVQGMPLARCQAGQGRAGPALTPWFKLLIS